MANNRMNISPTNVVGECNLKCDYYFNYSNSNCVVTNNHYALTLSYDKSTTPPVTYNNNNYIVSDINIVSPSLHLYNSNLTNAEVLIKHTPVTSGPIFTVCIPIKVFSSFSNSNSLMDQIISGASIGAPSSGLTSNLPLTNYNLTSLVPKAPFFSYSANYADYIVFDITSAIPITTTSLQKLGNIIKPFPGANPIQAGPLLYYNKKGPSASKTLTNNDIYIDCQPTDASQEEVLVSNNKPGSNNGIQFDLGNSTSAFISVLQMFLLVIAIFFILFGCYWAFTKINTKYRGPTTSTPGKTFKLTNEEGMSTAIYLIAYIMWAALLAVLYFVFTKQ